MQIIPNQILFKSLKSALEHEAILGSNNILIFYIHEFNHTNTANIGFNKENLASVNIQNNQITLNSCGNNIRKILNFSSLKYERKNEQFLFLIKECNTGSANAQENILKFSIEEEAKNSWVKFITVAYLPQNLCFYLKFENGESSSGIDLNSTNLPNINFGRNPESSQGNITTRDSNRIPSEISRQNLPLLRRNLFSDFNQIGNLNRGANSNNDGSSYVPDQGRNMALSEFPGVPQQNLANVISEINTNVNDFLRKLDPEKPDFNQLFSRLNLIGFSSNKKIVWENQGRSDIAEKRNQEKEKGKKIKDELVQIQKIEEEIQKIEEDYEKLKQKKLVKKRNIRDLKISISSNISNWRDEKNA